MFEFSTQTHVMARLGIPQKSSGISGSYWKSRRGECYYINFFFRNLKVTSSPVSDQSTPKHAMKNRHSTASTMSSPNISPIKPLLSIPETPTSTRKLYLSRQSMSPMECSTSVLDSSGIEIIGDALPDLSPIKANTGTGANHIQEVDLPNGMSCGVHEVSLYNQGVWGRQQCYASVVFENGVLDNIFQQNFQVLVNSSSSKRLVQVFYRLI